VPLSLSLSLCVVCPSSKTVQNTIRKLHAERRTVWPYGYPSGQVAEKQQSCRQWPLQKHSLGGYSTVGQRTCKLVQLRCPTTAVWAEGSICTISRVGILFLSHLNALPCYLEEGVHSSSNYYTGIVVLCVHDDTQVSDVKNNVRRRT